MTSRSLRASEQRDSMARFFPENFHHGSEAQLFFVGWQDLYDLLNFDAFDVCLLRIISL
jgi:hypothetical protein